MYDFSLRDLSFCKRKTTPQAGKGRRAAHCKSSPASKANSALGTWQDKSKIRQPVIFVVFELEEKEN